jgi:hypothetical protein
MSDGRPICSFRNGVAQLFFILFTREDWIELEGPEAVRLAAWKRGPYEDDEVRVGGFRTRVGVLRDRLDVLGVPRWSVALELERLAAERLEFIVDFRQSPATIPDLDVEDAQEVAYLSGLTWGLWLEDLRTGLSTGQRVERWGRREPFGSVSWLMSLWDDHDSRYQLRAVLEALPPDEEITLDLDDLLEGGWLEPSVDPRDHARELVAYTSQGGLAPIVLTEGRFDVEVLTAALALRRPHLIGYLKLPDFAQKNEGGAAALRQTVRAFASAGIPNRVVALFDNDTAARDVTHAVDTSALPANLVITRLPELDLASAYPTVGPQGEHVMDVNGLAGSIEMYLGSDVLTVDGELQPVVWGGYVSRLRAYQGEISNKERVQERFREKVAAAKLRPNAMADQDWSALDLVLDHLVDLVRHITLPGP